MLSTLPQRQRLAMAYATDKSRDALLTLLALDARLAGILRHSREPMLAQLRFAWWRESISKHTAHRDSADPLLDAIARCPVPSLSLVALVDGWEALVGSAPLPVEAFVALAEARAGGFAALAGNEGRREVHRMALTWALADIAAHLSDHRERVAVMQLLRARDWTFARLERAMRPLVVLHALVARDLRLGGNPDRVSPVGLLVALRAGILGF